MALWKNHARLKVCNTPIFEPKHIAPPSRIRDKEIMGKKNVVEVDEDLKDLIPQFLENRKNDLEALNNLISKQDLTAIAQLAHKIKGAAGGYGFSELSQYAARIESFAKSNQMDSIKDLYPEVKEHFTNVEIEYVAM